MQQKNQQPNLLVKLLGSAVLAAVIAILGLFWAIYSTRSEDRAWQQQLDSQATQIANQREQISLNAEQNRLLYEQATIDAQEATLEDQLRNPSPSNDSGIALTATALSIQSEATRQAIEVRQRQIEATQTAIAQPQSPPVTSLSSNNVDCSSVSLPHRNPVVGEPWTLPSGGWIIVNFWSNEPGIDQTEYKLLLGPNDPRSFLGGGSAWQWPRECEAVARSTLSTNPLPEISLEKLREQNLVR